MEHTRLARSAGIVGMVGGALWIASVVMQYALGAQADSGALLVVHEVVALSAMVCANIGFLGLIWGGAFRGRFGAVAVGVHVLAYGMIVVAGLAALLLGDAAGPLFLLFPIGGALEGVAALLLAAAVLSTGRWDGWQRWIPLLYSLYHILGVGVPMLVGATPNGPGMSIQIGLGVWWFAVGLAVATAQAKFAPQPYAVGQV